MGWLWMAHFLVPTQIFSLFSFSVRQNKNKMKSTTVLLLHSSLTLLPCSTVCCSQQAQSFRKYLPAPCMYSAYMQWLMEVVCSFKWLCIVYPVLWMLFSGSQLFLDDLQRIWTFALWLYCPILRPICITMRSLFYWGNSRSLKIILSTIVI